MRLPVVEKQQLVYSSERLCTAVKHGATVKNKKVGFSFSGNTK